MNTSHHALAAEQYGVRAQDYVTSVVHSTGGDLDQIETELRGQGSARVLDLGCGGGHVSDRAAPHVAAVVACDIAASMLDAVAATAAERGRDPVAADRGSGDGAGAFRRRRGWQFRYRGGDHRGAGAVAAVGSCGRICGRLALLQS